MGTFQSLFNAILAIAILYVLAILLKRLKVLTEDHSLVLARLVTDLCLPAAVFVSLSSQRVRPGELMPALLMLCLELLCIALAWMVSRAFGFSKAQTGAVVFCSAFGSSAFLGYALILEMFPDKPQVMAEAVLISEIGVGYPIFILGPILAAYFGTQASDWKAIRTASFGFFRSPVFFALILGILWGLLNLPGKENAILAPLFHVCRILASALTPLAILSVGLMFKIPSVRSILAALAVVVSIKLILKPLIAGTAASWLGFPDLWKEVLVLLAAMPPAILGAVFLRRYGGDASLASAILLVVTILSAGTILGVFWLVG